MAFVGAAIKSLVLSMRLRIAASIRSRMSPTFARKFIISIGAYVGGANSEYFSDNGDRPPKRGITLPIVEEGAYARLEFVDAALGMWEQVKGRGDPILPPLLRAARHAPHPDGSGPRLAVLHITLIGFSVLCEWPIVTG